MKRILTSAFVILFTIGAVEAQTTSKEKRNGHKQEHKMAYDKLNLSTDQQARMKIVRADFKKQSEELKTQDNLTVAEMKKRREALHKDHKAQMEAILTADQKAQIAKMRSKGKQGNKMGKREIKGDRDTLTRTGKPMQDRSAKKTGVEFGKELNLTADQQAKMKEIRKDYKIKIESVKNDNALSQEQKKDRMKELMKRQQEQVKMILTKEQIEKMQSLKKDRPVKNTK
jgi:Spy/CpxP family protein refolding chaperone